MSIPYVDTPYLLSAVIAGCDACLRIDLDLMVTGNADPEPLLELQLRGVSDPPDTAEYLSGAIGKALEHEILPGRPNQISISRDFCEPIDLSCASVVELRSGYDAADLMAKASVLARLLRDTISCYDVLEASTKELAEDLTRLVSREKDRSDRIVGFFGDSPGGRADRARGKQDLLLQLSSILERASKRRG